jgi:prepilin-type N-terminal cleavage/methylation domain-containing protein
VTHSARSRGFTLIEIVVVLALAALITLAVVNSLAQKSRELAKDRAVTDYVTDLSILARAAQTYAASQVSTWPADTIQTITLAQLQGAGQLPASFGQRATGVTTPLGTSYSVRAMKVTGQSKARVAVTEFGTSPPVTREAYGLGSVATDQTSAIAGVKARVGRKLADLNLVSATLAAGSTTAVGAGGNTWTKDIALYLSASPSETAIAVLSGWPDLDPAGGGSGGPTGGINIGKCRPVTATCASGQYCDNPADERAAVLPSGRSAQGTWPHCLQISHNNVDTFFPVAQNSAVMTLGFSQTSSKTFTAVDCSNYANAVAGLDPSNPVWKYNYNQCDAKQTTYYFTDVYLNNGKQYTNTCGWESWGFFTDAYGNYTIGRYYNFWSDNPPVSNDIFACE